MLENVDLNKIYTSKTTIFVNKNKVFVIKNSYDVGR